METLFKEPLSKFLCGFSKRTQSRKLLLNAYRQKTNKTWSVLKNLDSIKMRLSHGFFLKKKTTEICVYFYG
jgi:hypothetical protein